MMNMDERMAMRDLLAEGTPEQKERAKAAFRADMDEQRKRQEEAQQHWVDNYVPETEEEKITHARVKRTGVHPANASVPRGWNTRVDKLVDTIYNVDETATFSQFKSKFGGLRVYGTFNKAATEAVRQAELDCEFLCWWCGALATTKWNYEPACVDHSSQSGFRPKW